MTVGMTVVPAAPPADVARAVPVSGNRFNDCYLIFSLPKHSVVEQYSTYS